VVLAVAMEAQSVEAWSDSLGRAAFLVGMLAVAWFLEQMLRPSCGVLKEHIARHPNGWLAWLHYVWYPAAPLVPLALGVLAMLGYYYTALHLATRLLATLCLVLALVVAHAMVRRWLLVTRRHLAIQQARERRAQALSAQESPAPTSTSENVAAVLLEPEIDLSTINDQMSRLVRGMIGAVGVVGLWFIWVDVLPALGVLRQVPLWTTAVEVVKEFPQEDGTTLRRAVPTTVEITLADVGVAMLIVALTVIATRNIPGFIEIFALQRLPMDRGTRYAIATMSSYAITVVGILIASRVLGIGWSKVQWLVAAAALGLGFGLQEIFANLVSGMMILVERPIRVGDVVSVDTVTGVVSRVRIRATTITTWDRQELIIPNKEFITGRVMNWTLSDHVNRIVISVGVAYGSDTERARALILQIAKRHPLVLPDPEPTVYFEAFADSSLTLTLRAYLSNLENRLPVIHELHTAIDRAFRQANIEIAYPQRDLHLRTVPSFLAGSAFPASSPSGNGHDVKTAQAS
jgi:potassium efflux system protein